MRRRLVRVKERLRCRSKVVRRVSFSSVCFFQCRCAQHAKQERVHPRAGERCRRATTKAVAAHRSRAQCPQFSCSDPCADIACIQAVPVCGAGFHIGTVGCCPGAAVVVRRPAGGPLTDGEARRLRARRRSGRPVRRRAVPGQLGLQARAEAVVRRRRASTTRVDGEVTKPPPASRRRAISLCASR